MLTSITFFFNAANNFALGLIIAALLGPETFGHYAVALTVATTIATLAFDWLRLSATRYYGDTARIETPDLRASLDVVFAGIAILLILGAILIVTLGLDVKFSMPVLVGIVAIIIANSHFDLWCSLARSRFLNGAYAKLIIVRNVSALLLMGGAAMVFHSVALVLAALAASALIPILPVWREVRDTNATPRLARRQHVTAFARYGFPLVASNVIFLIIQLANRWIVATKLGYAEAGHLSLSTDLSTRILLAVGAGLDVYLFQLVVRTEVTHGRQTAQRLIAKNMLIVFAVLIPLAAGYAATLPSFAAVFIPASYQATFPAISLIMIPGILAFCFISFALCPIFQLDNRTSPITWASVAALVIYVVLLVWIPDQFTVATLAACHSASLVFACIVGSLLAAPLRDCWPRLRDFLAILVATGLMVAAIWPLHFIGRAWLAFASQAVVGMMVYGALVVVLDLAGLRRVILSQIERVRLRIAARLHRADDGDLSQPSAAKAVRH